MKISNKRFLLTELLAVAIICFSSITFAASGYRPHTEEITYGDNDATGFTDVSSYITVDDSNSIKFTDNDNVEHTLKLDKETKKYQVDNGEEITSFQILSKDGRILATVPGSVTIEDGKAKINLMNSLDDADFNDLSISFKMGNTNYTSSLGNLPNVQHSSKQETGTTFGQLLGDLMLDIVTFWDGVDTQTILRLVNYILNLILLPIGDGAVGFISRSVGEVVTIDRIIFDRVEKLSIDYWTPGADGTVKGAMANVVNPWYSTFRNIAVIVYMMMLVYVGIMIIINSTAESKAKYKDFLVSWVVGVCMLMFFPYVMKYIVALNNAVVRTMEIYIAGDTVGEGAINEDEHKPQLITTDAMTAAMSYGKPEFIRLMGIQKLNGSTGIMMKIRIIAYYSVQVFLSVIYLILIGEMLVLLIMYYKRAFMIAFLITIFPLVAMTYVIDKAGDRKAQSFEIWFKEYIVNVVVQIFHAVVYILVVGSAINNFLTSGGKNWLFVIISVLFLFQGEKILRSIFGIKSSANTIGDLATTGLATWGVVKGLNRFSGSKNDNASEQDKKDKDGITKRNAQRSSMAGSETNAAANARREMSGAGNGSGTGGGSGSASGGGSESGNYGQDTGNDSDEVGGAPRDGQAAMDKVAEQSMQRRWKAGLASRGVKSAGGVMGAMVGATYGMSNGNFSNVLDSAAAGKSLGEGAVSPLRAAVNKAEQKVQGERVAKKIASGSMDKELGLAGAGAVALATPNVNVDPDEVIGKHGETRAEIERQAYAEFARVASTKGFAAGRKAYFNYYEQNMMTK